MVEGALVFLFLFFLIKGGSSNPLLSCRRSITVSRSPMCTMLHDSRAVTSSVCYERSDNVRRRFNLCHV
jgi:hypothetical protein